MSTAASPTALLRLTPGRPAGLPAPGFAAGPRGSSRGREPLARRIGLEPPSRPGGRGPLPSRPPDPLLLARPSPRTGVVAPRTRVKFGPLLNLTGSPLRRPLGTGAGGLRGLASSRGGCPLEIYRPSSFCADVSLHRGRVVRIVPDNTGVGGESTDSDMAQYPGNRCRSRDSRESHTKTPHLLTHN